MKKFLSVALILAAMIFAGCGGEKTAKQHAHIEQSAYVEQPMPTITHNEADAKLKELSAGLDVRAINETECGNGYVYIYREEDGHIIRKSKGLLTPVAERILLVCTREDGQFVLANRLSVVLRKEGLNAHSFRHTHATHTPHS